MKFIDGVLKPRRIKTGVYVADGRAYFVLGNYVSLLRPLHAADLLEAIKIIESAAAPLRRPSGGTTQNYTQPQAKGLV